MMTTRSLDEVTIHDIIRIFRESLLRILAITLLVTLAVFVFFRYIVPPKYLATFSLYAWEGAHAQMLSTPDTALAYRNIVFSSRLLNDYQYILQGRTFRNRIRDVVDRQFPEFRADSYSTSFEVEPESHFIECSVVASSPEKAVAVSYVMMDEFQSTLIQLMNMNKIQVFGRPHLSMSVYSPRVFFYTMLAAILSFGGSFLVFFMLDFFRDLISDPDKMSSALGIPVLGSLAVLEEKDAKNARNLVRTGEEKHYKYSTIYENFQMILTNLRYSIRSVKGTANVILLTSSVPSEGKSFISANLAMMTAAKGFRTLLIGCDIRKPTLHEFFDLERGAGLVNFLLHDATMEQVIHKNVSGFENLDVLLSGTTPPNPVKILELFKSSDLLTNLRKQYDFIFLDAPPASAAADAFMLAPLTDGTIFVTRCGKCPGFMIRRILDKMRELHINIIGGILNFFDVKKTGYGYGYGYYYYYESETGERKKKKVRKHD